MLFKNLKVEVVIENISGANVGYDSFMVVYVKSFILMPEEII